MTGRYAATLTAARPPVRLRAGRATGRAAAGDRPDTPFPSSEDHVADLRFAGRSQCAHDDPVKRCFKHLGAVDTDRRTALDFGVCRGLRCTGILGIAEVEANLAAHDDLVMDLGEECLDICV